MGSPAVPFSLLSILRAHTSCLHVGPADPFSTSLVPILSSFDSTSGKIFQPYLLSQKSRLNFAALSSSDDIMSCSDSEQGR